MKILILCRNYGNKNSSNGICVKNLSLALQKIVHEKVYVLSPSAVVEENDHVEMIPIQPRIRDALKEKKTVASRCCGLFLDAIRYLISLFVYPNCDIYFRRCLMRTAERIIKEEKIDFVVGFYRPFETLFVLPMLKKKFSNIKVVSYYLDAINGANNKSRIVSDWKKRGGERYFLKNLKAVDRVFLPNSFTLEKCSEELPREKIRYVDFPLYTNDIVPFDFCFDHDRVNISFVGSLDANNRNPAGFIHVLRELNKSYGMRLLLHVWGKMDNIVAQIVADYPDVVKYHGFVENRYVSYLYADSDFLLNVCNTLTTNMVPSKIFQMFASKKFIINYGMQEDDASKPYFEKYPGVLELGRTGLELAVLHELLERVQGEELIVDESVFQASRPEYIARCLIEN